MNPIKTFNVMAKPMGPVCNLDCKYCFYLEKEKLYKGTGNFKMPYPVLESFIKQKIEAHKVPEVNFAWQGGEPTIAGVEYFRKVIEYQKKYSNGKSINNAFQTNGVFLDDEWCRFFNENKFLVGLSIDGPKEIHDKYRLDKGSNPTFDSVLRGMEYLKKHQVEFNTLTAVHRENSYKPLEVYNFLKNTCSGYIQFIPIVERSAESPKDGMNLIPPGYEHSAEVTNWSVESLQYGNFLCAVFDEWVRKDVGNVFVQLFDISLEAWYGKQPSLCVFRETCGDAMIIEHNGDIYSCDHYVYPENKLGNIMEVPLESLVNSLKQKIFGNNKLTLLPYYCQNCDVRFACRGECPKHRFIKTPGGEDGLNYLCAGYKIFFNHINVYMKYMVNEYRNNRPVANVVKWASEKDKGFPGVNHGRNKLCPCGSGIKYKKCCGINA